MGQGHGQPCSNSALTGCTIWIHDVTSGSVERQTFILKASQLHCLSLLFYQTSVKLHSEGKLCCFTKVQNALLSEWTFQLQCKVWTNKNYYSISYSKTRISSIRHNFNLAGSSENKHSSWALTNYLCRGGGQCLQTLASMQHLPFMNNLLMSPY